MALVIAALALVLLGIIFSSLTWAAPPEEGHGDPAAGHEGGEHDGGNEHDEIVPEVHTPDPHAAPPGGHGAAGPVFVTPPSIPTQGEIGR